MRALPAILLLASLVGAGDANGIDQPLKSPLAKRKRDEAEVLGQKGRAVHEEVRKGKKPAPEVLRQAIADLEEAIADYERAHEMEWSAAANAEEAHCVRSWLALREITPDEEPPADPAEKQRWQEKRDRAAKERVRDARRFVTAILRMRRHRKVFERCDRCDGRGELRSAFGDKSGCPVCLGNKTVTDRKTLMKAYWLCRSPFFRSDSRERAALDYVLRAGTRGEKRIAPFLVSARIEGDIEDHGWWFKVSTKEKVVEDGEQKKPEERDQVYVVVNIGTTWWLHGGRVDRELLVVPEG